MRPERTALLVRDQHEALAWSTDVLGLPLVEDVPLPGGGRWLVVGDLLLPLARGEEQLARVGSSRAARTSTAAAPGCSPRACASRSSRAPGREDHRRRSRGDRWDLLG